MQVPHKPTFLNELLAKAGRPLMPLAFGLSLIIFILALAAAALAAPAAPAACVSGPHNSPITVSEEWCAADNPHVLTGNVTVNSGVTLTIEAGVIVQGNANTHLRVDGYLEAVGTPAQPITFTSSSGLPGDWGGFHFYGGGGGPGSGRLRYAVVRYGGGISSLRSNIYVQNVTGGQVIIESSQVLSVSSILTDYGLYATGSNVVVSDTLFAGNGNSVNDYALYATFGSAITVTNNVFQNNTGYAARLEPDGPFVMAGNTFSGNGYDRTLLEGGVAFAGDNTLRAQTGLEGYELEGIVRVPANMTLTVEPGTAVIGRANSHLRVDGHLEAVGTPAQPITFTSSSGIPDGWGGFHFYGGGGNQGTSRLRYAVVRYGGDASTLRSNIYVQDVTDGQVLIESSQVLSVSNASTDYGLYATNSNVVVSSTLFAGNGNGAGDYALYATSSSAITVTNSAFQDNAGYGVRVDYSQASLACSSVANNGNDGVYLTGGSTTFWPLSSAIENNAGYGLNNVTGTAVDAAYNWWGAADGPGGAGPGSGDEVSGDVLYDPWLPFAQCAVDISVTKTDTPDPVVAGTMLTYTLAITNIGPGDATGVTLTDTLPLSMTFASAAVSQGTGCTAVGGDVICDLGDLVVDAGAAVTISVDVHPAARGLHDNTAVAGVAQTDRAPADNAITETTTVNGGAALSLVKLDSADPVLAGNLLTYTLALTNSGPSTALATTLTDTLPVSVTLDTLASNLGSCAQAGGVVVCDLGNVPPDSAALVTVTAVVDSAFLGTITNTASAASQDPAIQLTISETTTVNAAADLTVSKTDSADPVVAGLPLTYTLTIANNGPSDATGAVLTDTLPGDVIFDSIATSQGNCNQAGGAITCTLGAIPAGDGVVITVVVTTTIDGLLVNTAGITSDTPDPLPGNNIAIEDSVVGPAADLALTKSSSPNPVEVGYNITYTLAVTNNGPSIARNVTLTDTLPQDVPFVSVTSSQGICNYAGGVVTCDLNTLASGASAEVVIVASTSPARTGLVTNTAVVTADETDRFPANNTVSEGSMVVYFVYLPMIISSETP